MGKFVFVHFLTILRDESYEHVIDIDPNMKDSDIWVYAREHNLTIVTKDADFSDLVLLNTPLPRVIHIKLGNMKLKAFYNAIDRIWENVLAMSEEYKLVRVYTDKIEGVG